jgi:hypothetical protein
LSDAIRETGLCSTGIVLSGLRIGNARYHYSGLEKGLDHLWNDCGVSTVFKDVLKVLNIQHSVLFFGLQDGIEDGGQRFVRSKLKIRIIMWKERSDFRFSLQCFLIVVQVLEYVPWSTKSAFKFRSCYKFKALTFIYSKIWTKIRFGVSRINVFFSSINYCLLGTLNSVWDGHK